MQSFFYDEKLLVNADGTPTAPPATPSVKTDKADVASTPTSTLKRESLPAAGIVAIVASPHSRGSKGDKRSSHSSPSQAGAGPQAGDSVGGGAGGELKWDGDDELDALVDMVDMEVEGQLRLAFLVFGLFFVGVATGAVSRRAMIASLISDIRI